MIIIVFKVILLKCVILSTSQCFVINNRFKEINNHRIYPLNVQFKTQYGKRPHGTSSMKRHGASYVQELTHERCRLYKNKVLKDARMLFVRNVDVEITQDALDNFFHYIYGPLTSKTRLVKDLDTGKPQTVFKKIPGRHKGYGYITFSSPNIATRALLTLNGARLGDKQVYFSDVLYELTKNKRKKVKVKKDNLIKKQGIDDYRNAFLPIE